MIYDNLHNWDLRWKTVFTSFKSLGETIHACLFLKCVFADEISKKNIHLLSIDQLACTKPATEPIALPALLTLPRPLRGPAVRIETGLRD